MTSFRGILRESEIADVAAFVSDRFIQQRAENTSYHTPENGWLAHRERYNEAYPFVLGELPVGGAASRLSSAQQRGLRLFRGACVTCHENQPLPAGGRDWRIVPDPTLKQIEPAPGSGAEHDDDEDSEEYTPGEMSVHDKAPDLPDLSETEARGATLYQAACAQCHAADGTGENWIGEFLRPHPPDFTAPEVSRRLTEDDIARAVIDGLPQTSMPSFRGVLASDDVDAIIAYMRRAFFAASAEAPQSPK